MVVFEIGEITTFKMDPPANMAPPICLVSFDDLVRWGAVEEAGNGVYAGTN